MEAPITKFQAPRERDSNIEALILIGVTIVLAIVIAIVVIIMVKFCGGLWLRPLPQDLFSPRVMFMTMSTKDLSLEPSLLLFLR